MQAGRSGTFIDNMKLPVHRWFRYSAGFSAQWVDAVIADAKGNGEVRVFDPFAGSGTTLISAEQAGIPSYGVEAHPFVIRVARAKLSYDVAPQEFSARVAATIERAKAIQPKPENYTDLIVKCFSSDSLGQMDQLRRAVEEQNDGSPVSQLVWLCLVGILRVVSHVGTAPWQYLLPSRTKRTKYNAFEAFVQMSRTMASDMSAMHTAPHKATLVQSDARTCEGVPDNFASLVVTSPPYANNYDYADATRLEMTFFGEIAGYGELQETVRKHLMRSCSQHVPQKGNDIDAILSAPELHPIVDELRTVCDELGRTRLEKGGKKTYHLMAACYFADMARVWIALRRVCAPDARVCFVIGDSAPYGVYLPVVEWTGALAQAAGFHDWSFEKLRDRNLKWKNRKHRVPLLEGRLWVNG